MIISDNFITPVSQRTIMLPVLQNECEVFSLRCHIGECYEDIVAKFTELVERRNYEVIDCQIFNQMLANTGNKSSLASFALLDVENDSRWEEINPTFTECLFGDRTIKAYTLKRVPFRVSEEDKQKLEELGFNIDTEFGGNSFVYYT